MNRIYPPLEPDRFQGALLSILVGALAWILFGWEYLFGGFVFYLGYRLYLWLVLPSVQYGDETLNVITPLYTRKIPYSQLKPLLKENQEVKKGWRRYQIHYQTSQGKKKTLYLAGYRQLVPLMSLPSVPVLDILSARCGVVRGWFPQKRANQRSTAQSLEVTPKELLEVAYSFPQETLENPLLPLFALEDPTIYAAITAEARHGLIEQRFLVATEPQQRLFLYESVRFIEKHSGQELPELTSRSLEACRQFAVGEISQAELDKAKQADTQAEKSPVSWGFIVKVIHVRPDSCLRQILNLSKAKSQVLYQDLLGWQLEWLNKQKL